MRFRATERWSSRALSLSTVSGVSALGASNNVGAVIDARTVSTRTTRVPGAALCIEYRYRCDMEPMIWYAPNYCKSLSLPVRTVVSYPLGISRGKAFRRGLAAIAVAMAMLVAFHGGSAAAAAPGVTEVFLVPLEGFSTKISGLGRGLEGNMWFDEEGEGRIGRLSATGRVQSEFMVPTSSPPSSPELYEQNPAYYRRMTPPVLGSDGDMWFTDLGEYIESEVFIGKISPEGQITDFVIHTSTKEGHRITDLTPGAEGDMWFIDTESATENPILPVNNYIGRIAPSGQIVRLPISSGHYAIGGIAIGAEGDIWFTDEAEAYFDQSAIGRLTPSGVVSEFPLLAPAGLPAGIALGSDGNMWFTETGGKVGRITPDGGISEFDVPSATGQIVLASDGNMWFTEGFGGNSLGRITPTGIVTSFTSSLGAGGAPTRLVAGSEGNLWLSGTGSVFQNGVALSSVGRFVVPLVPVSVGLPVVSGEVVEGGVLSVSGGSWSNGPTAFGYQWQLCDASGGGCVDLGGEVAATHALRVGDVGHTLRVVVRASGPGGSASVVSGASAVVRAAPPRGPARVIESAPPAVRATMTWSFGWARAYTVVESLVVHKLPDGAMVGVVCRGRGCPFAKRHFVTGAVVGGGKSCKGGKCHSLGGRSPRGSLDITGLFKRRRLGVGAHITLAITKKGWTGKSFAFTIRTNKTPSVEITCLSSDSKTEGVKC